ncbi:hypothetical protein, conserved [Entamoeba histolytica]
MSFGGTFRRTRLSVLLSAIAREVKSQLSRAKDTNTEIVLYGLIYWFRVWDHKYHLKYSDQMNKWLDYIMVDIYSTVMDCGPLLFLLNTLYSGRYIPDIDHFN